MKDRTIGPPKKNFLLNFLPESHFYANIYILYMYNNREILHKNSKQKIRILQSLMKIPISKHNENQNIKSAEN
jgi:hypothetical protein